MKYYKRIAALISASLSTNGTAEAIATDASDPTEDFLYSSISVANPSDELLIAAHRSHQSHGSHRSHRSHRSSSGSNIPSVPSTPPPSRKQSEPLGQQPRPEGSYPRTTDEEVVKRLLDPEDRKNIIMRVQLTLQFEGYYDGKIDGIMGDKTREAISRYKKDKGITSSRILDAKTLNQMGVIAK